LQDRKAANKIGLYWPADGTARGVYVFDTGVLPIVDNQR
jgi:hypothetical protein